MAWRHRSLGLCAALIALFATGAATFVVAPSSGAAGTHPTALSRAGVIVDQGNGTVHRVGITFTGTITGLAALQLAGFSPSVRSFGGIGGAVCALDIAHVHYGCPTDSSCLTCAAPDYWAYARAPAGTQTFVVSRVGGGATEVHDGDVEGWRWGTGASPAYVPLDQIFPPTTTTSTPSTSSPPPPPHTTTSRPSGPGPGPTPTSRVGEQTTRTTLAPTGISNGPTSPTTVAAPGAGSTTSTRPGAHASSSTGAGAAHDAATASADTGQRATNSKLAAAPPIVGGDSGTSPFAWIGFGVVVSVLGLAIFAARRRSRRAAPSG